MTDSRSQREERLMAMSGGDKGLALELAELFLTHYGEMHENLRIAVESKDPLEVRKMVHTIEGSLGAMGSQDSVDCLLKLGQAGRDERSDLFDKIFKDYDDAISISNDVLKEIVSSGLR